MRDYENGDKNHKDTHERSRDKMLFRYYLLRWRAIQTCALNLFPPDLAIPLRKHALVRFRTDHDSTMLIQSSDELLRHV
jgi:hypothetical protein